MQTETKVPDARRTLKPALEELRRAKNVTYDVRHETPASKTGKKRVVHGKVIMIPSPNPGDADHMKIAIQIVVEEGESHDAVRLVWDGRLVHMLGGGDEKYSRFRPAKRNVEWPKGSDWINVLVPRLFFKDPANIVLPTPEEGLAYAGKETIQGAPCHLFIVKRTPEGKPDMGKERAWTTRWAVGADDLSLRRFEVERRVDDEEDLPGPAPLMTISNIKIDERLDKSVFTLKPPNAEAQSKSKRAKKPDATRKPPDPVEVFRAAFQAARKFKSVTFDARYESPKTPWADAKTVSGKISMLLSPTELGLQNTRFAAQLTIDEGDSHQLARLAWDGNLFRILHGGGQEYFETGPGIPPREMPSVSQWRNVLIPRFLFDEPRNPDFDSGDPVVKYLGKKTIDSAPCHVFLIEGGRTPEEDGKTPLLWTERWHIGAEDHLVRRIEQTDATGQDTDPIRLTFTNFKPNVDLPESTFTLKPPKSQPKTESAEGKTSAAAGGAPSQPPTPAPKAPKPETTAESSGAARPKTGAVATAEPTDPVIVTPPAEEPAATDKGTGKSKKKRAGKGGRSRIEPGDSAPDWELKDPQGKTHKLSDYRGKVILLDFWKAGCSACQDAKPFLKMFHEKYAGRGLVLLGINCFEKGDPIAYIKKEKLNYLQMLDGDGVAALYGVRSQPTFIFIGRDGKVAHRLSGHWQGMEKNLAAKIERLLTQVAQFRNNRSDFRAGFWG